MKATPCLECQVLQQQLARPPSPRFTWVIAIFAALYASCTALIVPAFAQLDLTKLNANLLTSAPVLWFFAIETIYSLVGTGLMVAFLVWYSVLIDWGRARGAVVPGNGTALLCWFVPFVNFVHPFTTIRTIARATGVTAPIGEWWSLFWVSTIILTIGAGRMVRGGYDPVFAAGSALQIGAVFLCWRLVRAFGLSGRGWAPQLALAERERQNVSTSAAPS